MTDTEIAAIIITAILVLMDYISGIAKAIHAKDVSSERLREGLWHKTAYVLVILLAEIMQQAQAWMDLGVTIPIVVPACTYICITEIASIIENLGELNPELKGSKLLQLFRTTDAGQSTPKHKAVEE